MGLGYNPLVDAAGSEIKKLKKTSLKLLDEKHILLIKNIPGTAHKRQVAILVLYKL